jgi:hypothetical protein
MHPDFEAVQGWSAYYFRWKCPDADGVWEKGYLVDSSPCVRYQKAVLLPLSELVVTRILSAGMKMR